MPSLLLSQTCNVIQQVKTAGTVGRISYTDTTFKADAKCKLDPTRVRSSERDDSGALKTVYRSVLFIENIVGLTTDMRIVLGSNTFEIISVAPIPNLRGINHMELEVAEMQTP